MQSNFNDLLGKYTLPDTVSRRVLFLAWESPWPAHSGAALRSLGLLKEINKVCEVDLVTLTRQPLTVEQSEYLASLTSRVISVQLRDTSLRDKIRAALLILRHRFPYHSAILEVSLRDHPEVQRKIDEYPGVIFTSNGHWGTQVRNRPASNWILNQCDADVEFWRVYASQAAHPLIRLVAQVNYRLAKHLFPSIYRNVGRVISVCEEDRQHTLALAPQVQVDVIENGIDCTYLTPDRTTRSDRPRLLFTGTSAGRNVTALRQFVFNTLPLIQQQFPDVELLVAGNFSEQAPFEFRSFSALRFTGRVDDIRPYFNQSDVFVAPFEETHGSKLKIAEAMAMAMPIVSTPQGVRGFSLVNGQSVLIANNDEEFSAFVVSLLRNLQRRSSMGQNACKIALSEIDWNVLGKRLAIIVEETSETLSKVKKDQE